MNSLVSVIVPIYNVEKYLEECLQSVVNQTICKRLEVLLIDDGSTDSSGEIAQNYADKYGWTYFKKDNGGQSSARNLGIDRANGKYIYFLDSDDYLASNALELLANRCENENLDILKFSSYTFSDGEEDIKWDYSGYKYHGDYKKVYDSQGLIEELIKNRDMDLVSPCCMIYHTDFLKSNGIRFIEGIKFEDNLFHLECISRVNRIRIDNTPLYYRRYRVGSTIHTFSDEDYMKAMGTSVMIADEKGLSNGLLTGTAYYCHDYSWKYAGSWSRITPRQRRDNRSLTHKVKAVIKQNNYWGDSKLKLFVNYDRLFLIRQKIRRIVKGI